MRWVSLLPNHGCEGDFIPPLGIIKMKDPAYGYFGCTKCLKKICEDDEEKLKAILKNTEKIKKAQV